MPVSATVRNLFSKARLLDNKNHAVSLTESELYSILLLICRDIGWDTASLELPLSNTPIPDPNYFKIPAAWFASHAQSPSAVQLQQSLSMGVDREADFGLYFSNLCSLHKRRLKYQMILSAQPKPTMNQVGTRSLLEYGCYDNEFLFNWLLWRKWIFDLDNRAAQETGYLFEPILSSSLGGVARDAKTSPVKRLDANGEPTSKGRQIDCYVGDELLAYEFKLRLTIAASGQGRWAEELSFPRECNAAGLRPILIVLDPTTSHRFVDLRNEFLSVGGSVYVGAEAWQHIKDRAGPIMARFVETYIKPALDAASDFDTGQPGPLSLNWSTEAVTIRIGDKEYRIARIPPRVVL